MRKAAFFYAAFLACALFPARAFAFPQVSTRIGLGGAITFEPQTHGAFSLASTTDVLFGPRLPDRMRVGPTLDLRTNGFKSFEPAVFATLLLPAWSGFPFTVGAGAGYAFRHHAADAPFIAARVTFGYRPVNYYGYGWAHQIYLDLRHDLASSPTTTLNIGAEIDLEHIIFLPVMFFWRWAHAGDPQRIEPAAN